MKAHGSTERFLKLTETDFSSQWYEKLSARTGEQWMVDLQRDCSAEENIANIHHTFDSAISAIHGVLQDGESPGASGGNSRTYGHTWKIDPRHGSGEYWYAIIDSDVILASMDLTLYEDGAMGGLSTEMIGFGAYEDDMPSYFVEGLEPQHPVLVGYAWKTHLYRQVVPKGSRCAACSVSLLPTALPRLAAELSTSAQDIADAMVMLNGYRDLPLLHDALEELRDARPSVRMAPAYYRAKVVECLVLLMDGNNALSHQLKDRFRDERTLCAQVSGYIRANLTRNLSTRFLCQMFHVSETKLISAFHATLSKTPQGYVREKRMEHAQGLLQGSNLSMKQIAILVGYSNQGAFAEAFKSYCGMSPTAYRRCECGAVGARPCANTDSP